MSLSVDIEIQHMREQGQIFIYQNKERGSGCGYVLGIRSLLSSVALVGTYYIQACLVVPVLNVLKPFIVATTTFRAHQASMYVMEEDTLAKTSTKFTQIHVLLVASLWGHRWIIFPNLIYCQVWPCDWLLAKSLSSSDVCIPDQAFVKVMCLLFSLFPLRWLNANDERPLGDFRTNQKEPGSLNRLLKRIQCFPGTPLWIVNVSKN